MWRNHAFVLNIGRRMLGKDSTEGCWHSGPKLHNYAEGVSPKWMGQRGVGFSTWNAKDRNSLRFSELSPKIIARVTMLSFLLWMIRSAYCKYTEISYSRKYSGTIPVNIEVMIRLWIRLTEKNAILSPKLKKKKPKRYSKSNFVLQMYLA